MLLCYWLKLIWDETGRLVAAWGFFPFLLQLIVWGAAYGFWTFQNAVFNFINVAVVICDSWSFIFFCSRLTVLGHFYMLYAAQETVANTLQTRRDSSTAPVICPTTPTMLKLSETYPNQLYVFIGLAGVHPSQILLLPLCSTVTW